MADLKVCFEKMGFEQVVTFLQSGNVTFTAPKTDIDQLKQHIEQALTNTFSYPAKAQIYNLTTLREIVTDYPFDAADNNQHDYVIFIESGLEQDLVREAYTLALGEKVQPGKGVVYWQIDKGSTLKSSFAKVLTKAKYKTFNTNRNIKTLQKIIQSTN